MLYGKRVILRPLEMEDAPETLKLRHDHDAVKAMMGFPFPVNLENEKEWITNLYPRGERKSIYMAIIEKETKKFLGYLSAQNINYINGTTDFGLIIEKESRRKGVSDEAMRIFFGYLYRQVHLRKVYGHYLEKNTRSKDLCEKFGYYQEGVLKEHIWHEGEYQNVVIVAIFLEPFKGEGL